MNNEIRERYLKLALVVSGIAFLLIYPLGLVWPSRVAFGLGLAWWRGQLLFADDQRCLFGPRHFSDCRRKESCRKPQPDFLHHLVERRACGNHGGSGTL